MSILKNLKKKRKNLDLKKAHQVVQNINKLREMKLLHVDLGSRKFSLEASLWNGKDQVFKNNWCKSVALFWDHSTSQITAENEVFRIHDIATNNRIAFYSRKNGCYTS